MAVGYILHWHIQWTVNFVMSFQHRWFEQFCFILFYCLFLSCTEKSIFVLQFFANILTAEKVCYFSASVLFFRLCVSYMLQLQHFVLFDMLQLQHFVFFVDDKYVFPCFFCSYVEICYSYGDCCHICHVFCNRYVFHIFWSRQCFQFSVTHFDECWIVMIVTAWNIVTVQQHTNSQTPQSLATNRVEEVRSEVNELKGIMVRNIGLLMIWLL